MLNRIIKRFFSEQIKSAIKYQGELYQVTLQVNSRLSSSLKQNNVPLLFECQQSADCGTCSICFDQQTFDQLNRQQPINASQLKILGVNQNNARLSCQMKTTKLLEGKIINLDLEQ